MTSHSRYACTLPGADLWQFGITGWLWNPVVSSFSLAPLYLTETSRGFSYTCVHVCVCARERLTMWGEEMKGDWWKLLLANKTPFRECVLWTFFFSPVPLSLCVFLLHCWACIMHLAVCIVTDWQFITHLGLTPAVHFAKCVYSQYFHHICQSVWLI